MFVVRILFKVVVMIVFTAIVFSGAYYYKLESKAQQALLRDVKIAIEDGRLPKNFSRNIKVSFGQLQKNITKNFELISKVDLQQITNNHEGLSFDSILCPKTKTTDIEQAEEQSVYFWVDKHGQKHFSDKPPEFKGVVLEDLSSHYEKAVDYFELNVNVDKATLEPFAEDRIRSDVTQIYNILSSGLNVKDLRKVNLNIRLFDSQEDFQVYKEEVAPGIITNSGFFSGELNEAAVYQWPNHFSVTRSVIRHESSHVILAGLFGITPVWFNEGLAEYFERLEVSGQQKKIAVSNQKLGLLRRLYDDGQLPALKSLLAIDSHEFYAADSLDKNYALAWSFVHFMLSSDKTKTVFTDIADRLHREPCGDVDIVNVVDSIYLGGFTAFEKSYYQWLLKEPQAHYY